MRYDFRTLLIKVATILVLFGFSTSALAAVGSFEKRIAIGEGAIVDVTNPKGDVVVRGADVDEVTIRARISINKRYERTDPQKAGKIIGEIKRSPPIELVGKRVVITKLTKHTHQRYASINYEILVPRKSTVIVHSESGDVRVSGVSGEVKASSDTGEVTVANSGSTKESGPLKRIRAVEESIG